MAHIHELYDFTVSAFILHPTEPKICLHYHKKLNSWLQPGGHIELNETPPEALEHELDEETGLDLAKCTMLRQPDTPTIRTGAAQLPVPFQIFTHYYDDVHQHIDMTYLLRSYTDELSPQKGESQTIEWLSLDEIQKLHSKKQIFDNTLDICEWIFKQELEAN